MRCIIYRRICALRWYRVQDRIKHPEHFTESHSFPGLNWGRWYLVRSNYEHTRGAIWIDWTIALFFVLDAQNIASYSGCGFHSTPLSPRVENTLGRP